MSPANVIAIAPQKDAPDLTARITYSEAVSDGRLLWTFETTHGIDLPTTEIVTDVGSRPQLFARELIEGVASHRGDAGLVEFLTGVGRSVSEKVPEQFFTLLAAVAAKLDRPPRVLLLSQEPYVPVGARRRRTHRSMRTRRPTRPCSSPPKRMSAGGCSGNAARRSRRPSTSTRRTSRS